MSEIGELVTSDTPNDLRAHEVLALGVIFHLAKKGYPLRPLLDAAQDANTSLLEEISAALAATLPDVELMDLQPLMLGGQFDILNRREVAR